MKQSFNFMILMYKLVWRPLTLVYPQQGTQTIQDGKTISTGENYKIKSIPPRYQ